MPLYPFNFLMSFCLISAFLVITSAKIQGGERFFGPYNAAVVFYVDGSLKIKSPDGRVRSGKIGMFLQAGDRLETGAYDRADIYFKDASRLTLGAEAKATLLHYIHDSRWDSGQSRFRIEQGPFSVQAGRLAAKAPAGMTIVLPRGAIDLRGGRVMGVVLGRATRLVLVEAIRRRQKVYQATVRTEQGAVELIKIAMGTEIPPYQHPPTPPFPWKTSQISLLQSALGQRP